MRKETAHPQGVLSWAESSGRGAYCPAQNSQRFLLQVIQHVEKHSRPPRKLSQEALRISQLTLPPQALPKEQVWRKEEKGWGRGQETSRLELPKSAMRSAQSSAEQGGRDPAPGPSSLGGFLRDLRMLPGPWTGRRTETA